MRVGGQILEAGRQLQHAGLVGHDQGLRRRAGPRLLREILERVLAGLQRGEVGALLHRAVGQQRQLHLEGVTRLVRQAGDVHAHRHRRVRVGGDVLHRHRSEHRQRLVRLELDLFLRAGVALHRAGHLDVHHARALGALHQAGDAAGPELVAHAHEARQLRLHQHRQAHLELRLLESEAHAARHRDRAHLEGRQVVGELHRHHQLAARPAPSTSPCSRARSGSSCAPCA